MVRLANTLYEEVNYGNGWEEQAKYRKCEKTGFSLCSESKIPARTLHADEKLVQKIDTIEDKIQFATLGRKNAKSLRERN